MIKIKLPVLKLDFNKKKSTLLILFLLLVIESILLYFNFSILFKDTESLMGDDSIESNQETVVPSENTRSTQPSGTRKLNPSVSMYKKQVNYYENTYYSGGRLIQMTTEEDPVLSVLVSDYTDLIKIFIYKIDEKALLEYLTYDSEGNQTNVKMDMSSYQEVGSLEVESAGRESFSQAFPIEEPGIYFIRSEFDGDKLNDCIVVRSPYSSVVKEGNGEYIFWTQGVKDMKKVENGSVTLYKLLDKPKNLGTYHTDTDGVTKAKLIEDADIAVIKNDNYYSVTPINLRNLNVGYGSSYKHFQFDNVVSRYFTFVDRPIYKPGDTVYFKSVVRDDFDAEYSIPNGRVRVAVSQYGEEESIYENNLYISSDGTVSSSFKIPETVKTGTYYLNIYFPSLEGDASYGNYYRYLGNVSFQVEHYRKPEYFIEVNSEQNKIISGDKAKFTISGNYFSGQPLANKKVTYDVYISDSYEGYDYPGYQFYTDDYRYDYYDYYGRERIIEGAEVTLNREGKADVEVDFSEYGSVDKESGYNKKITLVAKYQDLSMNTTTRAKNILVLNGDYSIFKDLTREGNGLSTDDELPIILVPNGNTNVSNIGLTAKITKEKWVEHYPEGKSYRTYKLEKEELPSLTKTTDNDGKVVFSFPKIDEGSYRVVIEGSDKNENKLSKEFYVGRYYYCYESARESSDGFNISSDKEVYYPSDSLVLNIDSKIPERDALVTVERGHVRRYQVVNIKDSKAVLTIPILETDIPNIYVSISSFYKNSFISKSINVSISADSKKLFVNVTPDKETYKPGDEVVLNIHTKDHRGNPVSANLAVWAIDKALFEVAYNNLGSIFDEFWFHRYNGTNTSHSLIGIGGEATEHGGGGGGGDSLRDDFEDTAYWNSNVNTDSNGMARLSFKLPDNLTTWVISAIGSDLQTRVGSSTNEITVSKDVILRPFLPNILREGDAITLSSTVNNFTKENRYFDVSLDFDSGDVVTDNYSKSLIKPNSYENFSWSILPKKVGDLAKLTFTAVSDTNNNFNDGVVQTIPVREYGFNQKNCKVGGNEISYPVNFSEKINKEKSYLEVSLATGLLGTIPDSVKYLLDYPFGCIEQTISRFVPLVIAKRNPTFFGTALKNKNIDDMIVRGLRLLESHQQHDGGWVWWGRESGSDPFITVYVLEYILEARELGFEIDSDVINSVKYYISNLYSDPSYTEKKDTKKQEEEVIKSYARALLREGDYIEISNFEGMTPDILSIAIMANYLSGYFDSANAGLEKLKSMAVEHGSDLYWESGDKSNFGSIDASTAFAIRAISTAKGDLDYAVRGARYLVNNRKNYYWSNTFATAQITKAIIDFSEYSEENNPNYSYTVYLDDELVKAGTINSPNQLIENITIPVDSVSKDGSTITIKKEGQGQLYSTVCVNEFINDRETTELSNGISVKREYLNDNGDKYQKMAVGDTVTVKITVNSKEKGLYGVISDELPSGLIPINTALKNTSSGNSSGYYNYNNSVDITENGAVFYANNLNTTNVFQYKAQVISEGTFYVPPATASLMYNPEIFGRSNSEVVVVDKSSVIISSEKPSSGEDNKSDRYDLDKGIEEENTREEIATMVPLMTVTFVLLLLGVLLLLEKNVTLVQIKDWFLGYIKLILKSLSSLLNKITRNKS